MARSIELLTKEETEALGKDVHRHEELRLAIDENLDEMKIYSKKCGFCMGPCPYFTKGANPCDTVPKEWFDRINEVQEMIKELIKIREYRGLSNS